MPPLWEVRVRTPINVARKPLSCPPAQPSSALLHPMASPAYDPSAMYMKPVCMRKERARTPSLCLYRSKALVKPIPRSTSARSPAYNPIRVRMHTWKENSASLHHTLSNTHIVWWICPNFAEHHVIEMSRANLCGRSTNFHTIKLRRRPVNWEYRE